MKTRIAERSAIQGFARSRLPKLSEEEIDYIRGSSDVFGLNHYSTFYASRNQSVYTNYESPSFFDDMAAYTFQPPEWRLNPDAGVATVPWGFYKLLQFIKREYNNPPVFITENGFGNNGGLKDNDRVTHLKSYLCALLKAINHGSDIIGYSVWSLLDSFEWMCGYKCKFGLYQVDYSSENRTRTPRLSAYFYQQLIRTGRLDPNFEPDLSVPMTSDFGY
ncbi:unnamed protein product [Danaus chrysippus]|uniref:beta-glucosidase n=1 Tax=Danaus chrysippus TaxID=151541 RepID=A0A8J2QPK6_9NEOP|nr:unnamed protein product [Danaus chrysippus]